MDKIILLHQVISLLLKWNWFSSIYFNDRRLGAYIANSIAGRAAIASAFIVSIVWNKPAALYTFAGITNDGVGMGFLGSILFGLLIGYTVKWINTWNVPKNISAVMPIFVIPLGVALFYGLIAIFVVGAPIAYVMGQFINTLKSIFVSGNGSSSISKDVGLGVSIAIGILIGAMVGFAWMDQLIK